MIASSQSSSDPQASPTQGGESGEAKPSERWRKILRWTPSVAAGLLIEKRYARQSEFEAVGGQSAVKCTSHYPALLELLRSGNSFHTASKRDKC